MALRDIDPFVDTPEGRAFFPYHRFAPGYLLAPADEAPLKRFLLKARWGSFGLIVPYLLAQPWVQGLRLGFFLIFVALTSGAWLVAIAVRCRGFARTRSPMPRLDTSRRVAAALSKGFIVFGLLTCLLFTVGSVAMYRLHVGDPAINVVAGILFGGFWLWYCRIALIRWRAKDRLDALSEAACPCLTASSPVSAAAGPDPQRHLHVQPSPVPRLRPRGSCGASLLEQGANRRR